MTWFDIKNYYFISLQKLNLGRRISLTKNNYKYREFPHFPIAAVGILYISTTCLYFIFKQWIVWIDDEREVEEGQI